MPVEGTASVPALFFLVAPLVVALAYSRSLCSELRGGRALQAIVRTSRTRCYGVKALVAFVAGGLAVAVSLAVNFAILACFLPLYTPDVGDILYTGASSDAVMSGLFYTAPAAYVALRLLLDFVLASLWAMAVLGVSTILRNPVALIVLPYMAVLVAKYVTERLYILMPDIVWRQSIALIDLLRARGDAFHYGWEAVAVAALAMPLLAVAPTLLPKGRDALRERFCAC